MRYQTPITRFEPVQHLVRDDLRSVDEVVRHWLASDVVLVRQIAEYIIAGGGKRFRPLLHLLCCQALEVRSDNRLLLAAIIEFIHTATLLHDDVVDASDRRRGRASANRAFGNSAAVLVGDFLYSRSFQMMVEIDSMPVMSILADTTNTIAAGEVLQLMNLGDPAIGEERYFDVIYRKTAKLFESAARLAAVLAGRAEFGPPLAEFGRCLGVAFQITDDMLDYAGDPEELGKNLGDDLAEGKPTLPLLRALSIVHDKDRKRIEESLRERRRSMGAEVVKIVQSCDAIDYCRQRAEEVAEQAQAHLDVLPPSEAKSALSELSQYAVERHF